MTDLRKAAQQALEALERLQNAIYNIGGEHVTGLYVANDAADSAEKPMGALRAALAQQAEPSPFDTVLYTGANDARNIATLKPARAWYTIDEINDKFDPPQAQAEPAVPSDRAGSRQQEQAQPSYERGFLDGMQKQAESSVDRAVTQMALRAQERATPVKPAPPGFVGVTTVSSVSVTTQHRVLTDADLDAIRKIVREGGKE